MIVKILYLNYVTVMIIQEFDQFNTLQLITANIKIYVEQLNQTQNCLYSYSIEEISTVILQIMILIYFIFKYSIFISPHFTYLNLMKFFIYFTSSVIILFLKNFHFLWDAKKSSIFLMIVNYFAFNVIIKINNLKNHLYYVIFKSNFRDYLYYFKVISM